MNLLPFSYNWLIKKSLDSQKLKTILDLGCGKGDFGLNFNEGNKYDVAGIEIHKPYLETTKKTGKYQKLISADLTKKLKFKSKSFDAVVCLQVIEHLKREEGEKLLRESERVTKKLLIYSAPVGDCSQEAYDENIYQQHHSAWSPQDFRDRGFEVFGVGLKLAYGSHAQKEINPVKVPLYIASFFLNPLANFFPEIGAQMVAVKIIKR